MLHKLSVAPMMGCTDRHCRFLFRLLSPRIMLYSEMITSAALINGDRQRLLQHSDDSPCAVQLGGSDPQALAQAARMVEDAGYQEVNLNCGCPSDRVQQGGIGACLMAEPDLVADCYRAMASSVSIPITIKSRIGIDDQDSFDFFATFIGKIYEAGCRTFHIHARKAILTGLTPKENREIPPLKYDYVSDIAKLFPDAAFSINGGIRDAAGSLQLLEQYDGIMLGRAPYANPYLLNELDQAVHAGEARSRFDVMQQYVDYAKVEQAGGTHIKHIAKHLLGLFTGFPGARAYRRHLSNHMFSEGASPDVILEAATLVDQSNIDQSNKEPLE